MRALSIRQPYAELILRGVKTIEYRSRPTRIIGERFYLYAARGSSGATMRRHEGGEGIETVARRVWSDELAVPSARRGEAMPPWMLQLAEMLILDKLPRGVIVGTACIDRCTPRDSAGGDPSLYEWHLRDVHRLTTLRKPARQPQPVWFLPF